MWNLTEGCIASIMKHQKNLRVGKPIVQLLAYQKEGSIDDEERYQIVISDGIHFTTFALLDGRFNEKIDYGELPVFTIFSLDQYTLIEQPDGANLIQEMMLIFSLTIIANGQEVGKKIGEPTLFDKNDDAAPELLDLSISQSSNRNATTIKMDDDVFMEPCDQQNSSIAKDESHVIKMRGLPWSVTVDDILSFFGDCQVKGGENGVHLMMSRVGRRSGEAFLELASPEDERKAMKKDLQHMGRRYIEVFSSSRSEMEWIISHSGESFNSTMDEGCVRIRGLPYGSIEEDVLSFFAGLEIVPNGISFATDDNGHATGEAYVRFVDRENLEKALKKHMDKIGHRYIEIFRSSLAEWIAHGVLKMRIRPRVARIGRTTPYNRSERFGGSNRWRGVGGPAPPSRVSRYQNTRENSGVGEWNYDDRRVLQSKPPMSGSFRGPGGCTIEPLHCVHMRGLPFKATEEDIAMFFRPFQPSHIAIIYNPTNRPSGEATVRFVCHEDALGAMTKDKMMMSNRYIELKLDSAPVYQNKFDGRSNEGGASFRPPFAARPRGGMVGGRIDNRARSGRPVFLGQGRNPFMSRRGFIM